MRRLLDRLLRAAGTAAGYVLAGRPRRRTRPAVRRPRTRVRL